VTTFEQDLENELADLRSQGLRRELRRVESAQSPHLVVAGQEFLNFSSNDYLGLANEGSLKEAARQAIERYGTGAGASRLICGSLRPHHELEESLASFKGTEAALSFSTGYAAALGVIAAVLSKEDIVILDKLVHASIVDAARLSGAHIRVFPHNDLNRLESILAWANKREAAPEDGSAGERDSSAPMPAAFKRRRRILVVTESVFSMDGDHAPLREILQLKEKYGACLMVDEAHATGLYGPRRSGLAEHLGVGAQIEIQMSTLGKALGSSGGCICGSRKLIDLLVNRARSFVFSTAPVPAAAAAAEAAIRFVQSELGSQRCQLLWDRVDQVQAGLQSNAAKSSAIVPILVGGETQAIDASSRLRDQGVFIPAIRYPTVARGRARLRLTLSAAHTQAEVARALAALGTLDLAARGAEPKALLHASPGPV